MILIGLIGLTELALIKGCTDLFSEVNKFKSSLISFIIFQRFDLVFLHEIVVGTKLGREGRRCN